MTAQYNRRVKKARRVAKNNRKKAAVRAAIAKSQSGK